MLVSANCEVHTAKYSEGRFADMSLERNNSAEIFWGISRKIVKFMPSGLAQIAFPGLSTDNFRTILDGK